MLLDMPGQGFALPRQVQFGQELKKQPTQHALGLKKIAQIQTRVAARVTNSVSSSLFWDLGGGSTSKATFFLFFLDMTRCEHVVSETIRTCYGQHCS